MFTWTNALRVRVVSERRMEPTRSSRKARGETMPTPETPAAEPSLPSARQIAWLLSQPTSALDAVAAAMGAHVEQGATASAVAALARRLMAFVRASGVGRTATPGRDAAAEFVAWITTAKACSAPAIVTIASRFYAAAAVRAALTEPWSGGQA